MASLRKLSAKYRQSHAVTSHLATNFLSSTPCAVATIVNQRPYDTFVPSPPINYAKCFAIKWISQRQGATRPVQYPSEPHQVSCNHRATARARIDSLSARRLQQGRKIARRRSGCGQAHGRRHQHRRRLKKHPQIRST
jgi:hypothetical protein